MNIFNIHQNNHQYYRGEVNYSLQPALSYSYLSQIDKFE